MKKLKVAIISHGQSGRDIHGAYSRSEEGQALYGVVAVAETIDAKRTWLTRNWRAQNPIPVTR